MELWKLVTLGCFAFALFIGLLAGWSPAATF